MEQKTKRLAELDIFRGFLVLGMIVFHSWLHLYEEKIPEAYFHFVPTGFVLFAGILIGKVLSGRKTSFQIYTRGLKLFIIFLLLNVPFWIVGKISLYRIAVSFIQGNPTFSSFEILLPIALTIISAPFFLKLRPPSLFFLIGLLGLGMLDLFQYFPYTVKFFIIGVMGIFFGRSDLLNYFLRAEKDKLRICISFFLSAILVLSLPSLPLSWSLQMILTLSLFLWVPYVLEKIPGMRSMLMNFGKYSLILYIFHVVLIQSLKHFPLFVTRSPLILFSEIIGVTLICVLVVSVLEAGRKKSPSVEKAYRIFFQ